MFIYFLVIRLGLLGTMGRTWGSTIFWTWTFWVLLCLYPGKLRNYHVSPGKNGWFSSQTSSPEGIFLLNNWWLGTDSRKERQQLEWHLRLSWLHFSIQWLLELQLQSCWIFLSYVWLLTCNQQDFSPKQQSDGWFCQNASQLELPFRDGKWWKTNENSVLSPPTGLVVISHTHISHYGLCSHGQPFSAGKSEKCLVESACIGCAGWIFQGDEPGSSWLIAPLVSQAETGQRWGTMDSSIFWSQSSWPIPIWNH